MSFARRTLALAVALIASLVLSGAIYAAEFTDAQKKELGPLIREYLLQNPEVLREAFRELERRGRQADASKAKDAIKQRAADIFRAKGDLVVGNPEGTVTMVEFFDYNCGYCKRALPDVLRLIKANKDLRVVMKEFPILGSGSVFAAKAALAARAQGKYWEFHLAMLKRRGAITETKTMEVAKAVGLDIARLEKDINSEEIKATLALNMSIAQTLGIQGTPAFIIDDTLIPGAVGFDALSTIVAAIRKQGGCKVC